MLVEPFEGQFAATLVGAPQLRVVGPTRAEAIAALRAEIALRVGRGELLSLEMDALGASDLAGGYADDPTLTEICRDAYQRRDAEPRE
ncbi:MAG: hypothetical protein ACYTG0_39685 [Planctomycetota bacterium]